MDEEKIKALVAGTIAESLKGFGETVTAQINTANQGVVANLSKEIAKLGKKSEEKPAPKPDEKPKEEEPVSLEVKALRTELEKLSEDLEVERAAKESAAKSNALTGAIAASGAQNPSALKTILEARYEAKLQEENGAWFVADGAAVTPLTETIKSYLSTDEGKYFVPPSGVKGSGATETKGKAASNSAAPTSAESALMEAFADI